MQSFKHIVRLFALVAIVASTMMAFKVKKLNEDLWQMLGISKEKGEDNIESSFLNGYFYYYGASKAKNILTGNREAVARDLMMHTKQLVNSASFKNKYEKLRNNSKPQEPEEKTKSKEEIRKEKIQEMEKSIAEAEKTIKAMPEMKKDMQPVIEMLKTTLEDYKNPESQNIELYYQSELYEQEYRMKSYRERLAQWEKNFPSDPNQLIRERLKKFITLAKTVDFSAELKIVGNKKKFVKAEYEAKPYEWKMIFRAGKEVIVPAMDFAEKWMVELK